MKAALSWGGLEPSMTKLGAGVDKLEIDLLHSSLLCVGKEGLPQGEDTLLGANATTLDHEVLLNLTIVGETTHGVDGLVSKVIISGGVILHQLKQKAKVSKKPIVLYSRSSLF